MLRTCLNKGQARAHVVSSPNRLSTYQGPMQTRKIIIFLMFIVAAGAVFALQQDALPAELKDAALHDAACTKPDAAPNTDGASADTPILAALPIRAGGREMGTIVTVQGAGHCQTNNCDTLV